MKCQFKCVMMIATIKELDKSCFTVTGFNILNRKGFHLFACQANEMRDKETQYDKTNLIGQTNHFV